MQGISGVLALEPVLQLIVDRVRELADARYAALGIARADGLVGINPDLCIGCGYCAVACPYQARYISHKAEFAFGEKPTEQGAARFDALRTRGATKCAFCSDRVDAA